MVSKRLGQYIEYKGISYYAFENSIGVGRGSISKAVKENKSIGSSILENILSLYPDLNAEWLLSGQGAMLKEEVAPGPDGYREKYYQLLEKMQELYEENRRLRGENG